MSLASDNLVRQCSVLTNVAQHAIEARAILETAYSGPQLEALVERCALGGIPLSTADFTDALTRIKNGDLS